MLACIHFRRCRRVGCGNCGAAYAPAEVASPFGYQDQESQREEHQPVVRQSGVGDPAALVDEVLDRHGKLDIVVAVHARSSEQTLVDVTATELDRSWAANVRSIVLLAQRFADRHTSTPTGQSPTGRMIWFTSGQHREPMDNTLAYAVTKGALHQMTATLGRALSQSGIVANCINPGPVDTGWADPAFRTELEASFPDQRWGTPTDVANLVAFLVGDEGSWIRGQVIDSEGGFDRSSLRG